MFAKRSCSKTNTSLVFFSLQVLRSPYFTGKAGLSFCLLSAAHQLSGWDAWQVRDQLTSEHEQALYSHGGPKPAKNAAAGRPQDDAVKVDIIVSTIGFPLVGGPAGTMEGGRQAEVAKAILQAKNIPYVVAAPLLIQVIMHVAAGCMCLPIACS